VIAIHQQDFTNLRLSVAGIIFLGAPFQGSDVAGVGTRLAQLSGLDSTILKLLEKDSANLYALSRDFWGSHSDRDLVCFYEMVEAKFGPIKTQVCLCTSLHISAPLCTSLHLSALLCASLRFSAPLCTSLRAFLVLLIM
jgi:hypothetical protein